MESFFGIYRETDSVYKVFIKLLEVFVSSECLSSHIRSD